ncbi:MAG: diaminopimelate epimerase [Methanolinea sp.]|jgi:diaminopimelate epimerase|nr:diaminopimelate epimerase [Methanolinea sp.]
MELHFTKLQGNGNDFILIDEYERIAIPDEMKAQFAMLYCDRRFGIGADGVLYLSLSKNADLKMRLLQPDESEAEMCGNGIRCFAKYAHDSGYVRDSCTVETLAGIIPVEMAYRDDLFSATSGMPEPKFLRKDIPATGEGEYREKINGFDVYAVNTGVPHAVIFTDALDSVDLAEAGPKIRRHPTFPKGANANFVERSDADSLRIRTYERGVEEETLSCGTGATAAAAVAHHLGYVGSRVEVETRGGPLTIFLEGETKMEGPATTVFAGTILF